MPLKMKELVARTGESKSTLLYYVKEGLLPEPLKPKPNVHLYDESSVEIVRFIKYLQEMFSYTLDEIKTIFDQTSFDREGGFEMMVHALEIAARGKPLKWYTREAFLVECDLNESQLQSYLEAGYLLEHPQGFGSIEVEIVSVLKRLERMGLERRLIDAYVESARAIAVRENEAGARMFDALEEETPEHYELMFDIVLKLKPYLYNIHSVKTYYAIKKEHA